MTRYALSALACALLATGPARGEPLAPAGDVDGDLRGDVLWRIDGTLEVRSGADLNGDPLCRFEVAADAVIVMGGDVNGDGLADVLIGEPSYQGVGRVRIVLGCLCDVVLEGASHGDRFGAAIAAVDLDGDGYSELLVGAPGVSPSGWVGLYPGAADWCEDAQDGTTPDPFDVGALTALTALGSRLERVWDVDGDGRADVLIGGGDSGCILGVHDDGLKVIQTVADVHAARGLGDVDGDGRAELAWWSDPDATDPTSQAPGEVVVPVGDLDGDHVADVLIRGVGGLRAVSGARQGVARRVLADHGAIDPAAQPIGDVDGDGFADLGWTTASGDIIVWRGGGTLFGDAVAVWRAPEHAAKGPEDARIALAAGFDYHVPDHLGDVFVGLPFADRSSPSTVAAGVIAVLYGDDRPPNNSTGSPYHRWLTPTLPYELWLEGAHAGRAVAVGPFANTAVFATGMPGLDVTISAEPGWPVLTDAPGAGAIAIGAIANPLVATGATAHRLGSSIAFVGDVDGDGLADFADVAPGVTSDANTVGRARVTYGTPTTSLGGWSETGVAGAPFQIVAAAGDLNGDGFADFAVGMPEGPGVKVFPGGPSGPSVARALTLTRTASDPASRYGEALVAAGDLDGDGFGDLAVGAPRAGAGFVEVLYGERGVAIAGTGARTLALSRTHRLDGAEPGERFGAVLAAPGDVDGDGFADLVVAAPHHSVAGATRVGRVALFRGGPNGVSTQPSWQLTGELPDARLGLALASQLDWNGDGFGDLAVAALADGRPSVLVLAGNDGMRGAPVRAHARSWGGSAVVPPWTAASGRHIIDLLAAPRSPFAGAVVQELVVTPTHGGPDIVETQRVTVRDQLVRSTVGGLTAGTPYAWRYRARYATADAPLQPASRWLHGGIPGQPARVHFRTRRNHPPLARADRYRVPPGGLRVSAPGLLSNDLDVDSDRLRVARHAGVDRGMLSVGEDGGLTYAPEPGDLEDVVFTYVADDGFGGEAEATVTLELRPCEPARCAGGVFSVDVTLAGGGRGSVRCAARYDVEPPRLVCDLDEQDELVISSPICTASWP